MSQNTPYPILTLRHQVLESGLNDVLKRANITDPHGINQMMGLMKKQFNHSAYFDKKGDQQAISNREFTDDKGKISTFKQQAQSILDNITNTSFMRSLKKSGMLPDITLKMDTNDSYQASADYDEKHGQYVIKMSSGCFNPKNYDGHITSDKINNLLAKDLGHELGHLIVRSYEANTFKSHGLEGNTPISDPVLNGILRIKSIESAEAVPPAQKQGRLNGEEILCDIIGGICAKQSGYSLDPVSNYYQKKSKTLGSNDFATHHPSAKDRADSLILTDTYCRRGLKNILRSHQTPVAHTEQPQHTTNTTGTLSMYTLRQSKNTH